MSGTSLDGADGVLVDFSASPRVLAYASRGFSADFRQELLALNTPGTNELHRAALAAQTLVAVYAEVVSELQAQALEQHAGPIRAIGAHGQTVRHRPQEFGGSGYTLQLNNPALLAELTGLDVVADFRTADLAAGGQGAPLVPFFHHALARRMGADQPLAILNLGGVGNLTWIDPRHPDPAHPAALLAFDTGPANAPMNDLMLARQGRAQDEGGALALTGLPDPAVIAAFLRHPYFQRPPPKSLDRNAFDLLTAVQHLKDADALATLTHCAAAAVAQGAAHFPAPITQLLVAGGGRHNKALMQALSQHFAPVAAIDTSGLNGDMLEAQAFAYLAARVKAGLPTSSPQTTGVPKGTIGGQLALP